MPALGRVRRADRARVARSSTAAPTSSRSASLDVTVRRNGYGRQRDSFEADLAIAGLGGGPFPGVFIRAPLIERVGPGVEVLAAHDGRAGARTPGRGVVRYVSSRARRRPACARALLEGGALMSGHSKWHSIKHKKGAADAKRGKLFAVLIRQIEIAARSGGGDPDVERDVAQHGAEGARQLAAGRHHPARDQARDRRRRRRHLRSGHVRGLRRERRRRDRAGAHRQPQPHVGRDQEHLQPQRRVVRGAGRGVVAVRAQGHRAGRPRAPTRTS